MKKAALTALQVSVTLGILFLIFRDPVHRAEMATAFSSANPRWLLLGLALYGAVEFFAGLRWLVLLRVQGINLRKTRLMALVMIGLFFNFFAPGGTGGDMVKVFYLLKETPGQRAAALLSVIVDRLIGLVSLIVLAATFLAVEWQWLNSTPRTAHYVEIALLILAASSAALVFSFVISGMGWVHKLPARFPGREKLAELARGYNLYGRAWRNSLLALFLSIVVHLGYFLTYFCAAKAFTSPTTRIPSWSEFLAIAPVVDTIVALPISIGGMGVREGLFQIFLGDLCGVIKGVAFAISSSGYLLTLCWGLVGALIYLFYRPSEHARMSQMREEVGELEHRVAEEELEEEAARAPRQPPQ